MALIPTPDIYGYTIFCDDIREELGGKQSFVGCYPATMFVHVPFPATLPIFATAVTVMQRRKAFEPNFSLCIFLPGDADDQPSIQGKLQETNESKVAELTAAESAELHPDAQGDDFDEQYITLNARLKFSQLILKQPGLIKVRAIIGENTYRLGTLRVSPPPQGTVATAAT